MVYPVQQAVNFAKSELKEQNVNKGVSVTLKSTRQTAKAKHTKKRKSSVQTKTIKKRDMFKTKQKLRNRNRTHYLKKHKRYTMKTCLIST